ncbi:unnamed protein product [Debaryomyces tyrocola]|nr:unnamed protein product [Debaryomyces tyrocola]
MVPVSSCDRSNLANNFPVLHVHQSNVLESNESSSILRRRTLTVSHTSTFGPTGARPFLAPEPRPLPVDAVFLSISSSFRHYTKTIHSVGSTFRLPKHGATIHEIFLKSKCLPNTNGGGRWGESPILLLSI